MLKQPISVYDNWAAYDELSDNVPLTEELAMREFDELLRLRGLGVRFDYYLMDAFWYAKESGYREWRKPHWPDGPDRFLARCREHGVKPGLWVATNNCGAFGGLAPYPAWQDSLTENQTSNCMFVGGFLMDLMEAMDLWYTKGVRMFKFDFGNLNAATPAIALTMLPSEIRQANTTALSAALKSFRHSHPEVVLLAYNGFEEVVHQTHTSLKPAKIIDAHWIEVFDSLYCGDPRPADVPSMTFWRSKDIYSDHMVRLFELSGIPLERIDNCGFMIGTTGTCYGRGKEAWKGMLLLSLARGGWVNTYYGNLELLDARDGGWFAKVQAMYRPLQQYGRTTTWGAMPGSAEPYGLISQSENGALVTLVNPRQSVADVAVPSGSRLLFRDGGFRPVLTDTHITLGPEQLVLVGTGRYADDKYDLGIQDDVVIPASIASLPIEPPTVTVIAAATVAETVVTAVAGKSLRIIFRQVEPNGTARRITGGSAPKGRSMGQLLRIEATQNGKTLPVTIRYDKQIWSALSWGAGEVAADVMTAGPVNVRVTSTDLGTAKLVIDVYAVG